MAKIFNTDIHDLKETRAYEYVLDFIFCVAGSLIYACSVTMFTAPNKIAPGGITGIATMLYYTIHTPLGVMIFIINIPLLVLGLKLIGGSFIIKTIICTFLSSFFVDMLDALHTYQYSNNILLAAIYGGVLSGVGLALVFLRGATTGGTDVASRLLKLKFRHVSMGRMMLIIDSVIILLSAVVFKSIDSALYAMITEFASSKVIDAMLYGSDNGKMAIIISDNNDLISEAIINEMNRGLTILKGRGYYTGREREVIMCAVRRPEAAKVRSIVNRTDPSAFIIMCEASEVIGEGFKPITKEL